MIPRFQSSLAHAAASHGWVPPIMEEAVAVTPILSVQHLALGIMFMLHIIAQVALPQAHSPSAASALRPRMPLVLRPQGWIAAQRSTAQRWGPQAWHTACRVMLLFQTMVYGIILRAQEVKRLLPLMPQAMIVRLLLSVALVEIIHGLVLMMVGIALHLQIPIRSLLQLEPPIMFMLLIFHLLALLQVHSLFQDHAKRLHPSPCSAALPIQVRWELRACGIAIPVAAIVSQAKSIFMPTPLQ